MSKEAAAGSNPIAIAGASTTGGGGGGGGGGVGAQAAKMPRIQHSPPALHTRSRRGASMARTAGAGDDEPEGTVADDRSDSGSESATVRQHQQLGARAARDRAARRENELLMRQVHALTAELENLRMGLRRMDDADQERRRIAEERAAAADEGDTDTRTMRRDEREPERSSREPSPEDEYALEERVALHRRQRPLTAMDDDSRYHAATTTAREAGRPSCVTDLMPYQVRLPRGGWIKNPFEELAYRGKSDRQNPIRWLERFERLANYERVSAEEQYHYFGRCLKGAAAQWFELQEADHIEEMKRLFREHFWGCQAQMRFRQRVYFGRYRDHRGATGDAYGGGGAGQTMTEYALEMARQAKTLVPPMSDAEIVQTVREHFDTDVARELRPSVARTVNEMIEIIDVIENERETRRLRGSARRECDDGQRYVDTGYGRRGAGGGGEYRERGARTTATTTTTTRNARRRYRDDGQPTDRPRSESGSTAYTRAYRRIGTDQTGARTRRERDAETVEIVEMPDSDDADGKPRSTRYERTATGAARRVPNNNGTNTRSRYAGGRQQRGDQNRDNGNGGRPAASAGRDRGMAAISAAADEDDYEDPDDKDDGDPETEDRRGDTDDAEADYRDRELGGRDAAETGDGTAADGPDAWDRRDATRRYTEYSWCNSDSGEWSRERKSAVNERESADRRSECDAGAPTTGTTRRTITRHRHNPERRLNIVRLREMIDALDDDMAREQKRKVPSIELPMIEVRFGDDRKGDGGAAADGGGQLKVRALVDTGAQVTAMSSDLYRRMRERAVPMETLPIRKFVLRGAFSERGMPIATKVRAVLRHRERRYLYEFYVVERLAYELVLGVDFITRHRMRMTCDAAAGIRLEFEARDGGSGGGGGGIVSGIDDRREHEQAKTAIAINVMTRARAEEHLCEILERNGRVFDGTFGRVGHYEHEIRVMSGARPFKRRTYPIPEVHMPRVREYMRELEREGIVSKRATQYVNPLVVVVKRTGDIRLCLDARELNKITSNDHAQPPTIDEVFARVGRKRYFTTLDIANAFWQIPLSEESREYTGFAFDGQTYVFNRMPFGLKQAGASFTRAMHLALGATSNDHMIVYLDDVLVASETLEEHLVHVDRVLERLGRAGFRLNRGKCEFMRERIRFLGHTFDEIRAGINEETRQAVAGIARPRSKRDTQVFLGLVNWDRRFIKNLARKTRPLEDLLVKGRRFEWTEVQQRAFREIKEAFEEAPDLYLARPGWRYGMQVDAARSGLGARLYQYRPAATAATDVGYDDDGAAADQDNDNQDDENNDHEEKKYTVAYASRSLKGAEKNYTVTELECLAIVWALRKWHQLLLGRHVRVHTDHRALQWLGTCVRNNGRIARWFGFMQEFELEIVHVPGRENALADALSRQAGRGGGGSGEDGDARNGDEGDDNGGAGYDGYAQDRAETRRIAVIEDARDGVDTSEWVDVIRGAQLTDEALQRDLRDHPEDVYERDGLVRVRTDDGTGDRVALPGGRAAWRVMSAIHRLLVHFGTDKVHDFAARLFHGPNLARVARDVVASCVECQANKYSTRATTGAQYYELPVGPGAMLALDIYGPLPRTSQGYRYMLVAMDAFSKYTRLYPMRRQTIDEVTRHLEQRQFPERGVPRILLTDNGGQFLSTRWQEFAQRHGFTARRTSPYNPQSNPVERVMRELGRIVRTYAGRRHHTWHRIVERAERVINATRHASTGFTPSELTEDRPIALDVDPRLLPDKRDGVAAATAERTEPSRERKVREARDNLRAAAIKRLRQARKHGAASYREGERVWVRCHRRSDASRRLTRKIHTVYEGPYRVRRIIRPNAYLVEDLEGRPIGVYNARKMKAHREARLAGDDDDDEDSDVRADADRDERDARRGGDTDGGETDASASEIDVGGINVMTARIEDDGESRGYGRPTIRDRGSGSSSSGSRDPSSSSSRSSSGGGGGGGSSGCSDGMDSAEVTEREDAKVREPRSKTESDGESRGHGEARPRGAGRPDRRRENDYQRPGDYRRRDARKRAPRVTGEREARESASRRDRRSESGDRRPGGYRRRDARKRAPRSMGEREERESASRVRGAARTAARRWGAKRGSAESCELVCRADRAVHVASTRDRANKRERSREIDRESRSDGSASARRNKWPRADASRGPGRQGGEKGSASAVTAAAVPVTTGTSGWTSAVGRGIGTAAKDKDDDGGRGEREASARIRGCKCAREIVERGPRGVVSACRAVVTFGAGARVRGPMAGYGDDGDGGDETRREKPDGEPTGSAEEAAGAEMAAPAARDGRWRRIRDRSTPRAGETDQRGSDGGVQVRETFAELRRAREEAIARINDYHSRARERVRREEIARTVVRYAAELPTLPYERDERERREETAEEAECERTAEERALRAIARCERLHAGEACLETGIEVRDASDRRFAEMAVLARVTSVPGGLAHGERMPDFTMRVRFVDGRMTDVRTTPTPAAAGGPRARDGGACSECGCADSVSADGASTTTSVGVQVDLPCPRLYGERDPAVYQRRKFRPEELDEYGGPLETATSSGGERKRSKPRTSRRDGAKLSRGDGARRATQAATTTTTRTTTRARTTRNREPADPRETAAGSEATATGTETATTTTTGTAVTSADEVTAGAACAPRRAAEAAARRNLRILSDEERERRDRRNQRRRELRKRASAAAASTASGDGRGGDDDDDDDVGDGDGDGGGATGARQHRHHQHHHHHRGDAESPSTSEPLISGLTGSGMQPRVACDPRWRTELRAERRPSDDADDDGDERSAPAVTAGAAETTATTPTGTATTEERHGDRDERVAV